MSRDQASPWHTLTVSNDGEELDYDVAHPAECPEQPEDWSPRCWFDGMFFEHGEIPRDSGVYRARVWMENRSALGWPPDYDSGNEWEPVAASEEEK